MDLEAWRASRKLFYRDVAEIIGASSPAKARSYALGEAWPRPEQLERILNACPGVDLFHLHQRRLAWVRENRQPPAFASLPDDPSCDGVPTAESRP